MRYAYAVGMLMHVKIIKYDIAKYHSKIAPS